MRRLKQPRGIRGRDHDHWCGGGGGEELDLMLDLMLDLRLDMLDMLLDLMLDMLDG